MSINWYPIESTPNNDRLVLFFNPVSDRVTVEMARNYHDRYGVGIRIAHWLDHATHWAVLNLPGEYA